MSGTAAYNSNVPAGRNQDLSRIVCHGIRFQNALNAAQGWPSAASTELRYYEEFSHVTTISGPYAAPVAITLICKRINDGIEIVVPTLASATNGSVIGTITAALPVRFRPVTQVVSINPVVDTSVPCQGAYQITTGGAITCGFTPGANAARQPLTITAFTNSGTAGTSHCVIKYSAV